MLSPKEIGSLRKLMKAEDNRLPIVFNALGEPRRCQIFRSFLTQKRLCVSDIARTLGISMSLASQHLKILEITRLLKRERKGRIIYYRPNTDDDLVRIIIKAVK